MALPWLSALKIIPWKEVVDAAPALVAAAKGLRKDKNAPAPSSTTVSTPDEIAARLQAQLNDQEQRLQAIQTTVAELTDSHLRLLAALHALRRRMRWLLLGLIAALLGVAVVFWTR